MHGAKGVDDFVIHGRGALSDEFSFGSSPFGQTHFAKSPPFAISSISFFPAVYREESCKLKPKNVNE